MNKYPYYIIPDIEEFRKATGEERRHLARKIAVAIGDPVALSTVLELSPQEFANFYPDMNLPEPTTDETIDTFIGTFGDPAINDQTELEQIMTPVPSYNLNDLEALPELDGNGTDLSSIPTLDITDDTAKHVHNDVKSEDKENQTNNLDNLEESFRINIKNGNYQRALEIITEISLNNPKKSIYFADQMRFLKKLIELKSNNN